VAVKKKAVAKKAAPKKTTAKKVAKKSVAKKTTAKKSAAKKTTAKKVAKKSAPKKVAKKAVAKKAVAKKSTVKQAAAKKTVKKSPARKSAPASVVIPPVPTGASRDRVNVSTTPATPKPPTPAAKPAAAPRQGSSKSVLIAVLLGVAILTAIVASQQSKNDSTKPASPAATASESASPAATATESASPAASTDTTNAATTGEAPSRFIGNWKDSSTKDVLVLSWKAPAGDVNGYKVEIAPNGGGWKEVSQIPATQLSFDVKKTSDSQYTSFRVSAIYADGSLGVAKAFGFAGQFE
jgi:Tfp pilus assembly protein PilV